MSTRTADAVVIGGGILGAAVLHELAARGLEVVLLERGLPNRQGSGTTAGNLHIQAIHAERPTQGVPVDTEQLVPFQAAAHAMWAGLEARLGSPVDVSVAGGLTVAETEEQLALLHEKAVWERAAGIPTDVLTGQEARGLVPALGPSVVGATWCSWDGWANNLVVTPAYLAAARRAGATVHVNSPVTAIEQTGDGWTVRSAAVDVSTPVVVDAAGTWLDRVARMAGIELDLAPLAIQMLETVRAEPRMEHLVQHIGEGLSVKQVASGAVVIGGGWPAQRLDLEGVSPVSQTSIAGNVEQVRRVLPGLSGLRLTRAWAGPLAATPDEMPVVGRVSGVPPFHVVGGTYAFTFSPVWARAVADDVTGTPAVLDVGAFSPDRLLTRTPIGG